MRATNGRVVEHETDGPVESTLGMLRAFVQDCEGLPDDAFVRVRGYIEFNPKGASIKAIRVGVGDTASTRPSPER